MNFPPELTKNPHFSRYYRMWQKNPLSVVFIPLSQICREQGFLQEAQDICTQGLEHHPDSVSGRLMLAWIYYDREDYEQSLQVVNHILYEYPAQQEANTLKTRLVRSGHTTPKPPAPTIETNGASSEKPVPPPMEARENSAISPWENPTMAKIYAEQGEKKIALQILQNILQRDPQHMRAKTLYEELTS